MFFSLEQFEITRKSLGQGTYGDVRLGVNRNTRQKYALKIIDTKNLRAAELAAMDREVMTHSRLLHQNIVNL